MGAPPGFGGAPGFNQSQGNQAPGYAPNFPPAGNVDFNAPVVRIGFNAQNQNRDQDQYQRGGQGGGRDRRDGGGDSRRGMGVGFDSRRDDRGGGQFQGREQAMPLNPPSREEIMRTIFVGNITEGVGGDEGMYNILGCAGGLRRWTRVMDANNKPCTFGFAEFEDADSLRVACEVFQNVRVPKQRPTAKKESKPEQKLEDIDVKMEEATEETKDDENMEANDETKDEAKDEGPEMTDLLFVVDENSKNYVAEWASKGSLNSADTLEFKIGSAKDDLSNVLANLLRVPLFDERVGTNGTGDMRIQDTTDFLGGDYTMPGGPDDELLEIPPEMRETVQQEILAFRDRSNRRDQERLQREEEVDRQDRSRNGPINGQLSAQAGGANNIPVGPRGAAPTGPKGYTGAQLPDDYRSGVAFVNANGQGPTYSTRDDDDSGSDSEIEGRYEDKIQIELEKRFHDAENHWLSRERWRGAALERQNAIDRQEEAHREDLKTTMAKRLKAWDDDAEASRKTEEYYLDKGAWIHNRTNFRKAEILRDEADRREEAREQARDQAQRNRDLGLADQFLGQMGEELAQRQTAPEPAVAKFTMSLGAAAAQRAQAAASSAPRRGGRNMADVEGLLEDEEEATGTTRRTLRPIAESDLPPVGAAMSEEERSAALRRLAAEVPTDAEALFAWPVSWQHVDESIIEDQLRPFVERKIVEYLGVQEEMLVAVVEDGVRKRRSPATMVTELEGALDKDEAEALMKKVWRMVVFFAESERRGLNR